MKLKKNGHTICDPYLIFKKIFNLRHHGVKSFWTKVGDFSPMPLLLGLNKISHLCFSWLVPWYPWRRCWRPSVATLLRWGSAQLRSWARPEDGLPHRSPSEWSSRLHLQRHRRLLRPQWGLIFLRPADDPARRSPWGWPCLEAVPALGSWIVSITSGVHILHWNNIRSSSTPHLTVEIWYTGTGNYSIKYSRLGLGEKNTGLSVPLTLVKGVHRTAIHPCKHLSKSAYNILRIRIPVRV